MKKAVSHSISFFLWLLIVLVNAYKFVLINTGFLTEPDERRYLMSWRLLKKLTQGDFNTALTSVFSADGRPGSVMLHTIPATLQFIYAKIFGYELLESRNFAPVFFYNIIVNLLILYILYKIIRLLFEEKIITLFGLLLFSVLVNNFSYLRHIYPYNESLLLFLALTYRMLKFYMQKSSISLKTAFIWGIIAFTGILIYPAYYLTFLAIFIFFNAILILKKIEINKIIQFNFAYITGSLSIFFIFEFLSRLGHHSYINTVLKLSETVKQGDFSESYSFIIKYLWQVEKYTGLLLLTGIIVFIIFIPKLLTRGTKQQKLVLILIISFLIPYTYYTTSGYFGHQAVMYGRILHQFIIPVILMSLFVINLTPQPIRHKLIIILSILISIQFYFQMQDYLKIAYPRDVYWKYLKTYPFDRIKQVSEYKNAWPVLPQKLDSVYIDKNKANSITIVNGQYFYPVDSYEFFYKYKALPTEKQVFKKPHFTNYKAYQFEGYDIKAREILDSLKLQIKIFR